MYRVDPSKPGEKPELFFKSDEQHIRSLAWDGKGDLIAGSDGSGLVYRINAQGKGYVLFEAPHREITSVAVGADGTVHLVYFSGDPMAGEFSDARLLRKFGEVPDDLSGI